MDQGKLEVAKQEMARVKVYILRISKLKWTGMGEYNSDDHYIYYCGQESLRRNGVAITVNKRVRKCSTWMQSQKRQNDLCSFPRQTIQYHSNRSIAAAKSLQSCPTLCDPIDGSPPGFPVPGILQARTLEWVAISFSNA